MKPINFLDVRSSKERQQMIQWSKVSCCSFLIMLFVVAIMQIKQLMDYRQAYQNFFAVQQSECEYNKASERVALLQAEEIKVRERLNCCSNHIQCAQKLIRRCKALSLIHGDLTLQTFDCISDKVQITVKANSIEKVSAVMQNLNKEGAFGVLTLAAMQLQDKSYLFTIKESC
jgi:hypothetical protein